MQITDYLFGQMTIDGHAYTSDLKIIDGVISPNWWRQEGHLLSLNDIKEIQTKQIHTLLIGTGYSEMMQVSPEVIDYCHTHHIKLIYNSSKEIVKQFNSFSDPHNVMLAIHLTC